MVGKAKFSEIGKYKFLRFDSNFLLNYRKKEIDSIRLGQLFKTGRGRVLSKQYVEENRGSYPLYSSQTKNDGIFGYIDTYDFEGEYLTWTTDGAYAGTVFYRKGKFNCTNVCGTAKLKKGKEHIFKLKFLPYLLNTITKHYVSLASGNPKLMNNVFEEITVPLIDINIQNEVLLKIEPIEIEILDLKSKIQEPLEIVNEVFADYYGYSKILWKEFGKGMTAGTQKSNVKTSKHYKVGFSQIQNSKIMRMSSRFHNPNTQDLTKYLFSKPTTKISKIITRPVKRGKQPRANAEGTVYAIKTGQLKNDFIDISTSDLVTETFYYENERSQTVFGDILIASTGKVSLGKVDFNQVKEKSVVDGHISILKIENKKYNSLFLTYFLRSILGAYQIERDYTGATNQIELSPSDIENFDIPDISIKEQEKIVMKISNQLSKQKDIEKLITEKQTKINELIENIIKEKQKR